MVYLEAYKDYFIKVATLLGASLDNATIQAEELIKFETQLATVRMCIHASSSSFCLRLSIVDFAFFHRLHRHPTKDETFLSFING